MARLGNGGMMGVRSGFGSGLEDNFRREGSLTAREQGERSFVGRFDTAFGFRGVCNWTAHVAKDTVDGFPAVWVRIIFDDEQQREAFIASTEHIMGGDEDEIGVIGNQGERSDG